MFVCLKCTGSDLQVDGFGCKSWLYCVPTWRHECPKCLRCEEWHNLHVHGSNLRLTGVHRQWQSAANLRHPSPFLDADLHNVNFTAFLNMTSLFCTNPTFRGFRGPSMRYGNLYFWFFILVINQLDAQNLFYNKFISCLYMFRAPCARRQEVKIVLYSLWYHHTCRWPSRTPYQRMYNIILTSWRWAHGARNM